MICHNTQHRHSFCCQMTPQHSQYPHPQYSFTKLSTPPVLTILLLSLILSFNNNCIQLIFKCFLNILSLNILRFTNILNVKSKSNCMMLNFNSSSNTSYLSHSFCECIQVYHHLYKSNIYSI